MRWTLYRGDCAEGLGTLETGSIDSIVTDPPYALPGGFMGKAWDSFGGRVDTGFGYYLAGLADGEGCFRVQRHERGSHSCHFSIHLRRDDRAILDRAQRYTGLGTVTETTNGTTAMARWNVQTKDDCAALVGLFRKYPLRAKKRIDFEAWAEAVREWLGRPRGNRWAGPADQMKAAAHKTRIEQARAYAEPAWSGDPFQDWVREWATEALRVLKPGGHLLAFGGTRTYHRLASGIEDAGFDIRDQLAWLYGQGMPKSLNLPEPYRGRGTGLKPSLEPIVLARKPLQGTVQRNVERHGTGALMIDDARIPMSEEDADRIENMGGFGRAEGHVPNAVYNEKQGSDSAAHEGGRWPANVILDPEAADALDAQSGELRARGNVGPTTRQTGSWFGAEGEPGAPDPGDTGGASRFFYVAKASTAERNAGLDHLPKTGRTLGHKRCGHCGLQAVNAPGRKVCECPEPDWQEVADHAPRANSHPTVKPIELMRYLVRLVTPPEGTVLDPFTGSGTTGCAALLEGRNFLGMEREADYIPIIEARLRWWAEIPPGTPVEAALASERSRQAIESTGQESLL